MRIAALVILRIPQLFSLVEKMPSPYYRVKLARGCLPVLWWRLGSANFVPRFSRR
jgi:hypothetical protein